jgi:hypothetical protein
MTSEMTGKSYEAVRCFHCSEPIPLSARLLELCHVGFDRANAELPYLCQVFILRCNSCTKELHYLKSEIETFEGEPSLSRDMKPSVPRDFQKSLRSAAGQ